MLRLEDKILAYFVDFSKIMVQKFDSVSVENDNLILGKDKEKIKIEIKGDKNLIQKTINEKYNKELKLKLNKVDINLSELKTLPIIDYEKQQKLKNYIDDLVFSLYFRINLENLGLSRASEIKAKCFKNPHYKLISN
jgi:hypothetical protein